MNNFFANRQARVTYSDCPCCDYKQSLSITVNDGRQLYYCHAGCSQADLWRVIQGNVQPAYQPKPYPRQHIKNDSLGDFIKQLWDKARPATGTPVEAYLTSRGLTGAIPSDLRFLPNCPHKPSGCSYDAMLAGVRNSQGVLMALHRTYLAHDGKGKAPVTPAKMTLGHVGGYACHLARAGEDLIVAEGIETALSVQVATGLPAWAALSAGGIRNLILPPLPLASIVTIAADNDPVGLRSANKAAFKWREQGRRVKIAVPSTPDTDFNDMLLEIV